MKLRELLAGVEVIQCCADENMEITDVVCDSRRVSPGSLFVAITGFASDGNRFIPMALSKGAAVIVTAVQPTGDFPYVLVEDDRLALALISGNFYGHPAEKMTMIGITGTNGKTSVTLLLRHVLQTVLGAKVGLIGTMGNAIGDTELPSQRTTPESVELQALFARMRDAGCTHVVMEVSSHALALHRVGGVQYNVAAFTNLTEDHLDFHKTMENYAQTKRLLFDRCDKCVLNGDDGWYDTMREGVTCPVLTTTIGGSGDLRAEDVELLSDRVRFTAVTSGETAAVEMPIPGKFSVYNALTVLGVAVQLGIPLKAAAEALKTAHGVKGRIEVVPTPGTPYTVLIDYAHTPDGLENVLSAVRGFCQGRLIAVFGCGGDRDPMKRPIMGEIGVRLSDHAIITSDNPRTEEPMKIIRQIVAGISGGSFEIIENRRQAIRHAMGIAQPGDIIVLAGKGHETYQEIHGVKYHLDEREEVAAALTEMRQ